MFRMDMGTAGDALPTATVSSASAFDCVTAVSPAPAVATQPSGSRAGSCSVSGQLRLDAKGGHSQAGTTSSILPPPFLNCPVHGNAPSRWLQGK
jgi:hypothetical protein